MTVATKTKAAADLLNDYHLLSFDELDSTNEEAKRIAKAGGGHGAFIWAKKQSAGKGRMGRKWVSKEGNLFATVLLKPRKQLHELPQLSFVAAVAVLESLEDMIPGESELTCKWPNDILLDGKKLAGILLESFKAGDEGGAWVTVGVGVNVDSFPPKTEFPATCLKDAGVELISAKIILSRFIHHFIDCYNEWNDKGFASIRKRWLDAAWGVGERMEARLPDDTIEGVMGGIDESGSLVLKLDNGKKQHILAADLFPTES
ncbi:MAG: biotin--[acetyl-CoA-carboxylase] ligase [Rickettsiales bacterium]